MALAAVAFLDTLAADERGLASLPLDASGWQDWDYRPRLRPGLPLRQMSEAQRAAAWRLVEAALSMSGKAKTRGVLALEAILQERTANKAFRDPLNYALAILGRPGDGPWAWRFEGHHVCLSLTLVPEIGIAVTPHFFGANPFSGQVVADGHGGLAGVLERELALAFELVGGLGQERAERGADRQRSAAGLSHRSRSRTQPARAGGSAARGHGRIRSEGAPSP